MQGGVAFLHASVFDFIPVRIPIYLFIIYKLFTFSDLPNSKSFSGDNLVIQPVALTTECNPIAKAFVEVDETTTIVSSLQNSVTEHRCGP